MVKKELTKDQLSESYSIATLRMHNVITEFYEDLHERGGSPRINPGIVANMIQMVRVVLNAELDLIKEASFQHFEANYDKSEQESILFGDGEGS
jgi:hypothetical protein